MKSLIIALVLFLLVTVSVISDYFILDGLLENTKKELEEIPKTLTELEELDIKEKQ